MYVYTGLFSTGVFFATLKEHLEKTKLCLKRDNWDIGISLVLNSPADNEGKGRKN